MSPPLFRLSDVEAVDLAKAPHRISTGVGYFDHMIDQLNSHAQVGVSVTAVRAEADGPADLSDPNRHREPAIDQASLMAEVGAALGERIGALVRSRGLASGRTSRFCCPLDEALVECVLTVPPEDLTTGLALECFALEPYGIFPTPGGRTRIGAMVPQHLEFFFASLAGSMGLILSIRKVRGDNGHHVVESAFKAFSRALRNLLDGTTTSGDGGEGYDAQWGMPSPSRSMGLEMARAASLSRKTKETSINVDLKLDGMEAGISVSTGLPTLDKFFTVLANEAEISLGVKCSGDTWVDDHHTAEDVAIAVGQCLNKALGTKAGLNRMWCARGDREGSVVEVTVDLSNRPCLTSDLALATNKGMEEYMCKGACALTVEMFDHVVDSLVSQGQMTVHIVQIRETDAVFDTSLAAAMAFGRALKFCCAVDPRRAGKTASSKGTLSV